MLIQYIVDPKNGGEPITKTLNPSSKFPVFGDVEEFPNIEHVWNGPCLPLLLTPEDVEYGFSVDCKARWNFSHIREAGTGNLNRILVKNLRLRYSSYTNQLKVGFMYNVWRYNFQDEIWIESD